jgi:hypothetical protein
MTRRRRRGFVAALLALLAVSLASQAPPAGANESATADIRIARASKASTCTVSDASIRWGFKESFRSYISGTIANGAWTTSGHASYATPQFSWSSGTGTWNPKTRKGALAFTGAVRFTGHHGLLDTQISNPRLTLIGAGRSYLTLDVSNVPMDSAIAGSSQAVVTRGVTFVQFDSSNATVKGRTVRIHAAPTTLTSHGERALGNSYEAGTAFDPVSISLTLSRSCAR